MTTTPETTATEPPKDLRTQVKIKLADMAVRRASLAQTIADFETRLAVLRHAITEVKAPEDALLEAWEKELKDMALTHSEAIFGEGRRSLIESGLKLALIETESVEFDGPEDAICARAQACLDALQKDLSEEAKFQRMCLRSLLKINVTVNKSYVKDNYDNNPEWFESLGISLMPETSASLRAAPKPRESKAKLPKLPTPAQPTQAAA